MMTDVLTKGEQGEPYAVLSTRLPQSVINRLRRLAAEQDRTLQAVIIRVLCAGLHITEIQERIAQRAIIESGPGQLLREEGNATPPSASGVSP